MIYKINKIFSVHILSILLILFKNYLVNLVNPV